MEWVSLGAALLAIVSNLVGIAKFFEDKQKDGFAELVKSTYENMEVVVADYLKMLREAEEMYLSDPHSPECIARTRQYLLAAREYQLPSRMRIRGALQTGYFDEPGPLADFYNNVLSIMYSGYDITADTTREREEYLGAGVAGKHTILFLVDRLEVLQRMAQGTPPTDFEYQFVCTGLPVEMQRMRNRIERRWERVTKSYYALLAQKL